MNRPRILDATLRELVEEQLAGEPTDRHYSVLRWLGRQTAYLEEVRAELPRERNARRRQAVAHVIARAQIAAAEPASPTQQIIDDITDAHTEIAEIRLGLMLGPWWEAADAA